MVDQPGIEHRTLRIHGKQGTNEHKLNVPAGWHQAINKTDVPGLLVTQAGSEPAIVMNVDEAAIGKWAWVVARSRYRPGGQWTVDHTSALAHRMEIAIAGIDPAPVSIPSLTLDSSRQRARVEVPSPLTRAHRAALDAMCGKLGLSWDVPFDEARPAVELWPIDPAQSVISWSDAEEAKALSITQASIPLPAADDLQAILDRVVQDFTEDFAMYTKSIRAAASRSGILVQFRGTLPEFSVPGGKPVPFVAFKQASLADTPLNTWLDLETAFRSSRAGYELDMVPCLAIDLCIDGFQVSWLPVARKDIAERRASRGIVPLSPGPSTGLADAVVTEIGRLASSGISRKTWARGFPPPAFPDRYDEVPPLHCTGCGADMTAAAYGAETFVKVARCPSCGANHDVTFSRGEYAVAGLHRDKKASR